MTHDPVTPVDGGSGEPVEWWLVSQTPWWWLVAPVVWWIGKVGGSMALAPGGWWLVRLAPVALPPWWSVVWWLKYHGGRGESGKSK